MLDPLEYLLLSGIIELRLKVILKCRFIMNVQLMFFILLIEAIYFMLDI